MKLLSQPPISMGVSWEIRRDLQWDQSNKQLTTCPWIDETHGVSCFGSKSLSGKEAATEL